MAYIGNQIVQINKAQIQNTSLANFNSPPIITLA